MDQAEQDEIKRKLAENHACYVLVTCKPATEGGEMQVEMCYEGDPTLAAYLLEGAQSYLDQEDEESLYDEALAD